MPIDALQMLFSLLDPGSVGAKYRDFGKQNQASARAQMFVAIEDWLNDGVPLAAPVAREVLAGVVWAQCGGGREVADRRVAGIA